MFAKHLSNILSLTCIILISCCNPTFASGKKVSMKEIEEARNNNNKTPYYPTQETTAKQQFKPKPDAPGYTKEVIYSSPKGTSSYKNPAPNPNTKRK